MVMFVPVHVQVAVLCPRKDEEVPFILGIIGYSFDEVEVSTRLTICIFVLVHALEIIGFSFGRFLELFNTPLVRLQELLLCHREVPSVIGQKIPLEVP